MRSSLEITNRSQSYSSSSMSNVSQVLCSFNIQSCYSPPPLSLPIFLASAFIFTCQLFSKLILIKFLLKISFFCIEVVRAKTNLVFRKLWRQNSHAFLTFIKLLNELARSLRLVPSTICLRWSAKSILHRLISRFLFVGKMKCWAKRVFRLLVPTSSLYFEIWKKKDFINSLNCLKKYKGLIMQC